MVHCTSFKASYWEHLHKQKQSIHHRFSQEIRFKVGAIYQNNNRRVGFVVFTDAMLQLTITTLD